MTWQIDSSLLIQLATLGAGFAALWRKIGERDVQLGERIKALADTVGELKCTVRDEASRVSDLRLQLAKHSESLAQLHRDYTAIKADLDALRTHKSADHARIFEALARVETELKSIAAEVDSLRESS